MTRLEEKTSLLTLRSMVALSMPFLLPEPVRVEPEALKSPKKAGKDASPARREARATLGS